MCHERRRYGKIKAKEGKGFRVSANVLFIRNMSLLPERISRIDFDENYLLGCILQIKQRFTAAFQKQSQFISFTLRWIFLFLLLLRRRSLIKHLLKYPGT